MIKKGISILLLSIYLMVNFMPYVPYIYAATQNIAACSTDTNKDIVCTASNVNTGDVCYLKAIMKRSNEKKETKEPQIIIVNNLEFTPLSERIDICAYPVEDVVFMDYKAILVNHIKRPNSPPPKSVV